MALNPSVRSRAPLLAYFFSPRTGSLADDLSAHNWRPLATLTLAALARGENDPRLILRAASLAALWTCAVLLFFFARDALGDGAAAAFAAVLFALHPANVETAAFAIGLRATLSLAFMLAALLSRERGRGPAALAFQGFCFLAALGFKETAIVLPGLIWAHERWIARRPMRLPEYAYWSGLVLLYLWGRHLAAVPLQQPLIRLGAWERAALPFESVLACDLPDLFWPWNTHSLYHQVVFAVPAWREALRVAALTSAWGGAAFLLARRHPRRLFACAWIVLALLPTAGVLPGVDWQADRYLFDATAGLGLLAAATAAEWRPLAYVLPGLCVLFALRSNDWLPCYESHPALTGAIYALHPDDPEAALEFAVLRMTAGESDRTEESLLREAARPGVFFSTRLRAYYLLGCLQASQGRYAEAEASLWRAAAMAPTLSPISEVLFRVEAQARGAKPGGPWWPPPEGMPF